MTPYSVIMVMGHGPMEVIWEFKTRRYTLEQVFLLLTFMGILWAHICTCMGAMLCIGLINQQTSA